MFPSGGTLGAVQVGMLQALGDAGVTPDLVVGSSIGALNAALLAAQPGALGIRTLDEVWRSVRRRDVLRFRPWTFAAGLIGARDYLVSNHGLATLLEPHLGGRRLEDLVLPIRVVATDVLTGEAVVLASGDAVRSLLASAATPGVFEPVQIAGRLLCDGGVADSTPVGPAVGAGATEVWILSPAVTPMLQPRGFVRMAMAASAMMLGQFDRLNVQAWAGKVDVRVVPRPPSWATSPIEVAERGRLIDDARRSTAAWLDAGAPAEPLAAESDPDRAA